MDSWAISTTVSAISFVRQATCTSSCTHAMYWKSAPWSRPSASRFSSRSTIHFLQISAPADWRSRLRAEWIDRTWSGLPSSPLRYFLRHLIIFPRRPLFSTRVFSMAALSWAIAGVFFKNSFFKRRPSFSSPCTILPILASPAPYKKASLCSTEGVTLCPPFGCSMSP